MAASNSRLPAPGVRRAFTLPARVSQASPPATTNPPSASEPKFETLFIHPNARIVSFSARSNLTISPSRHHGRNWDDAEQEQTGTLPWHNATDRTLASGPMSIYRVPGSVAFLNAGPFLKPILAKSQCWCVDGETTFVLKRGQYDFYRIELLDGDATRLEVADRLVIALNQILRYEKTACPFKREFHVELPDSPQITYVPWKPKHRPISPVRYSSSGSQDQRPLRRTRFSASEDRNRSMSQDSRTSSDARSDADISGWLTGSSPTAGGSGQRSVKPTIGRYEKLDRDHERDSSGKMRAASLDHTDRSGYMRGALPQQSSILADVPDSSTREEAIKPPDLRYEENTMPQPLPQETASIDSGVEHDTSVTLQNRVIFEVNRESELNENILQHAELRTEKHFGERSELIGDLRNSLVHSNYDNVEASQDEVVHQKSLQNSNPHREIGLDGSPPRSFPTVAPHDESQMRALPVQQSAMREQFSQNSAHTKAREEDLDLPDAPFTPYEMTSAASWVSLEDPEGMMATFEPPFLPTQLEEERLSLHDATDESQLSKIQAASEVLNLQAYSREDQECTRLVDYGKNLSHDALNDDEALSSKSTVAPKASNTVVSSGTKTIGSDLSPPQNVSSKPEISSVDIHQAHEDLPAFSRLQDQHHGRLSATLSLEPGIIIGASSAESPLLSDESLENPNASKRHKIQADLLPSQDNLQVQCEDQAPSLPQKIPVVNSQQHSSDDSGPQMPFQLKSSASQSSVASHSYVHFPQGSHERIGAVIGQKMATVLLGPPLHLAALMLRIATRFTNGVRIKDHKGEGWRRRGETGRRLPGTWEYYSEDEYSSDGDWAEDDDLGLQEAEKLVEGLKRRL